MTGQQRYAFVAIGPNLRKLSPISRIC
jgi:hypothetical protein